MGMYDAMPSSRTFLFSTLNPTVFEALVPVCVDKYLWIAPFGRLLAAPNHKSAGLEDSVHFPEVHVEGIEEVDHVHAKDTVNGSVLQEGKTHGVLAPNVQSASANGISEIWLRL